VMAASSTHSTFACKATGKQSFSTRDRLAHSAHVSTQVKITIV
jgi:hypothetical protein